MFGILRSDINGIVNVGFQGGLCFVTFKSSEIFLLVKTCLFTVIDKHLMERHSQKPTNNIILMDNLPSERNAVESSSTLIYLFI